MENDEDEDDWMYKTFNAKKAPAQNKNNPPPNPGRSRMTENLVDEMQEFEESPFDMAPELSKQFHQHVKNNNFMFEQMDG